MLFFLNFAHPGIASITIGYGTETWSSKTRPIGMVLGPSFTTRIIIPGFAIQACGICRAVGRTSEEKRTGHLDDVQIAGSRLVASFGLSNQFFASRQSEMGRHFQNANKIQQGLPKSQ